MLNKFNNILEISQGVDEWSHHIVLVICGPFY